MNVERIDLPALAPQPWKNGAGRTREIAVGGPGDGAFDWRISLAEVARDAPFSAFAGVDRCIVLIRGAGMQLRSADGAINHALSTRLAPFRFPGDAALDAALVDGPCDDLNVMTRRGVFTSEVQAHRAAGAIDVAADALLLLAVDGRWAVGGATLAPLQALLWRDAPRLPVTWRPLDAGPAALLSVHLCHDRGR